MTLKTIVFTGFINQLSYRLGAHIEGPLILRPRPGESFGSTDALDASAQSLNINLSNRYSARLAILPSGYLT